MIVDTALPLNNRTEEHHNESNLALSFAIRRYYRKTMVATSIQKLLFVVAMTLLGSQLVYAQKVDLVEIDRYKDVCDVLTWCAFYPDSNRVVMSGCSQDWVVQWEIGKDEIAVAELDSSATYTGFLRQFSFNSDSSLAVSSDTRAVLWDTHSWEVIRYLTPILPLTHVEFTPDGSEIVILTWFGVKVIDPESGEVVRQIGDQSRYPKRAMDISSDGSRLVVATDSGDVWMYDYMSGEKIWSAKRAYSVYNIQFSPDGSMLLLTGLEWDGVRAFNEAAEYDAKNGQKLHSYQGYAQAIRSARYSNDGELFVTTSSDSTARIWSTKTKEEIASIDYGDAAFYAEFSMGGTRIAVVGQEGVGVWELKTSTTVSDPVADKDVDHLLSVHPNPVHEAMQVPFVLKRASDIRLSLYDEQGKEINVMASGLYEAGEHVIATDLNDVPSGVYLVVLRSDAGSSQQKISIIH